MMTENQKCSSCERTNVRALLIGIGSFIVFGAIAIVSSVLLAEEVKQISSSHTRPIQNVPGIEFKYVSINAMLAAILIVSALATFFSILLIIGVLKRLSGLVLLYFSFGILTTMIMLLGCLLLLIHKFWYISIVLFIATVIYIPCLMPVYQFYEDIIAGRHTNFGRDDSTEEELLSEDTEVSGTH